jgi:hypothetical protein
MLFNNSDFITATYFIPTHITIGQRQDKKPECKQSSRFIGRLCPVGEALLLNLFTRKPKDSMATHYKNQRITELLDLLAAAEALLNEKPFELEDIPQIATVAMAKAKLTALQGETK